MKTAKTHCRPQSPDATVLVERQTGFYPTSIFIGWERLLSSLVMVWQEPLPPGINNTAVALPDCGLPHIVNFTSASRKSAISINGRACQSSHASLLWGFRAATLLCLGRSCRRGHQRTDSSVRSESANASRPELLCVHRIGRLWATRPCAFFRHRFDAALSRGHRSSNCSSGQIDRTDDRRCRVATGVLHSHTIPSETECVDGRNDPHIAC